MIVLAVSGFIVLTGLALCFLQVLALRRAAPAKRMDLVDSTVSNKEWTPVSILKPLHNLDDDLFDNLESFCRQDYPAYEIIFALPDRNDPACRVVRRIKEQHPETDITILTGRAASALNPGMDNLVAAYRQSKYPVILISGGDVRVTPGYLRTIMKELACDGVGLVSNPVRGVAGRTLGARLENLYLNTFVLGRISFWHMFLKKPCVIGKSILLRKSDLELTGEWYDKRNVLSEIELAGQRLNQSGRKVILSRQAVETVNKSGNLRQFISQYNPGGQLLRPPVGWQYLAGLAGNPVFMSLFALLACPWRAGLPLFLSALIIKTAIDCWMGGLARTSLPRCQYLLTPLKDLLIGGMWFLTLLKQALPGRAGSGRAAGGGNAVRGDGEHTGTGRERTRCRTLVELSC